MYTCICISLSIHISTYIYIYIYIVDWKCTPIGAAEVARSSGERDNQRNTETSMFFFKVITNIYIYI